MNFIVNALDYLLSSKKTLIYTTYSLKDYYKIVGKLKAASVKYRVASTASRSSNHISSSYGNEYKFYVKEEDEHLAVKAINGK